MASRISWRYQFHGGYLHFQHLLLNIAYKSLISSNFFSDNSSFNLIVDNLLIFVIAKLSWCYQICDYLSPIIPSSTAALPQSSP